MYSSWVFVLCFLICSFGSQAYAFTKARPFFSDVDLQKVFKQSRLQPQELFVLYSWSPHMNLSLIGLKNISSQKNVTVLLDPSANMDLAEKSVQEMKLSKDFLFRNKSKILSRLGTLTHYPNYLFIRNGEFVGGILPGYKSEAALKRYIATVTSKRR